MNDTTEHNSMDFDPTNTLKRCNSTPIINHILPPTNNKVTVSSTGTTNTMNSPTTNSPNITSTTSRSRDASPTPTFNIFAPRARRYSTGFSPLAKNYTVPANSGPLPRLTPRVSQLRQEECADVNSREVNHEREIHTALQISQSWEDLTLDAEHWSFKSDTSSDLAPLHVTLPTGVISCSSPSPTSSRAGLRLPPYGLSPSPTRRTFQTRRSMSPIAMRPSSLGPVKRKFELDDNYSNSYSPPPFKKIFTESSSRGHSPCRSPLLCPSPDSTEGRTTPKFYISKLCTANTNSSSSHSSSLSAAPSPNSSSAMEIPMDIPNLCTKAVNSDLNSDLDCSDVDFDSDSQNKPTSQDVDDKTVTQKRDEACEKIKKLFLARVSTDSTETDCSSIDFKPQTTATETTTDSNATTPSTVVCESNSLNLVDNKNEETIMECDSSKKTDNFCVVQNIVSSTDDIAVVNESNDCKTMDIQAEYVPNIDCNISDAGVAVVVNTLGTDSTENST